ncbi:acyl-[ACP]--phospholipid O-acyltransferase [Methylophaga sp. 41_12_T18]|nr:acyl-[ACP]--phospholipid O-acyltransferase [Methylophaga sp. 41_12_T18]
MLKLFKIKGFFAFIAVAFINAFVDLGHKIIVQNTLFKSFDGSEQVILTAIVNGLILIPFILLFSPAGFVSDRFKKPIVMRWAARFAVLVTLIITLSYYQGWFYLAFAMTFILAVQSALYSPAKYGYIRDLLGSDKLSEGNSWTQSISMIAILSGIVMFSLMFENILAAHIVDLNSPSQILQTIAPLGWLLVIGSIIEALLAQRLPETPAGDPQQTFDRKAYFKGQLIQQNVRELWSQKSILHSIFAISVFWTVSQVLLAVFPSFVESTMGETNTFVVQSIMALAGIGIMVGSMIAGYLSRNHINLGLVPIGAIGFAISLILLMNTDTLTSSALIFFLFGLSGSLMIIPLNALIQFYASEDKLGKVLAGNNFIQNIAMLIGLTLTVLFSLADFSEKWLLSLLAIIGIVGAIHAIRTLPHSLVQFIISALIKGKYRIQVQGIDNIPAEGQGMLLLGNHISWLDWAMIQIASPRRVHFVMERAIYERWYLKWFLDLFGVIPISPTKSKQALEQVKQHLEQGEVVCLFPEGMISHTGQLGEFKRGFERAIEGVDAKIVPFYLRGLWGSRFSRSSTRIQENRRKGLKRDVIVAFGAQLAATTDAATVKQKVFELSIHTWQSYTDTLPTLAAGFIDTAKTAANDWAITEANGKPISYRRLLTGTVLFSQVFKQTTGQNLGLLVPTTTAGAMSNMAALMAGKTVVNLNYTASPEAVESALVQAEIKTVITSRQFVKRLAAKGMDFAPLLTSLKVIYLEDLAKKITTPQRLTTMAIVSVLPSSVLQWLYCENRELEDTAAILFSSGSEGSPKGVMLSHRNIMANLKQIADVLNIRDDDTVMATLPLFHAFGLTVTCFMPLIEGIPVVCHPDPTDAVAIGKGVAKYRATMLCATSTFLRLYSRNRKLVPMMFESLRLVVAGAEKLNPEIRALFENRFHKPILEGYGCTETTPVAGVNIPDCLSTESWKVQKGNKPGTIGLALPGSTFRIVDPDTMQTLPVDEAGLILIGGTQIMKGYLNNPQKTADVIVKIDDIRWYNTGDKGKLDADGFLTIVDRYSRFAKLAGEMVSLGDVEQRVRTALASPELPLVAINLADDKKGEKVILLLEGEHDPQAVKQQLIAAGMPALLIPANIFAVETVPLLGSGKTDFSNSRKLAIELTS